MSYRITKGEDLREQNYMGIHTVGRGSERPPVLLALDYNPTGDKDAPVFACGRERYHLRHRWLQPEAERVHGLHEIRHGRAATITGALAFAITRGLKNA